MCEVFVCSPQGALMVSPWLQSRHTHTWLQSPVQQPDNKSLPDNSIPTLVLLMLLPFSGVFFAFKFFVAASLQPCCVSALEFYLPVFFSLVFRFRHCESLLYQLQRFPDFMCSSVHCHRVLLPETPPQSQPALYSTCHFTWQSVIKYTVFHSFTPTSVSLLWVPATKRNTMPGKESDHAQVFYVG